MTNVHILTKPIRFNRLSDALKRVDIAKTFDDISILVAEDSTVNMKILMMFLRRIGIKNVIAVKNGEEAAWEFQQRLGKICPVGLILMDLQMPKMTGLQVTELIRKMGNMVPFIAVTANGDEETVAQCKSLGFNELLVKPCSQRSLEQTIRRFLPM